MQMSYRCLYQAPVLLFFWCHLLESSSDVECSTKMGEVLPQKCISLSSLFLLLSCTAAQGGGLQWGTF